MPRIALVTHSLGGGVWSVTNFIAQVLGQHSEYTFDIVRLATSRADPASVRLFAPATWWRGAQMLSCQLEGVPYRHVGAFMAELEFQRYQPRRLLTDLLNQYDLIQVVCGSPAWAVVTRDIARPVALQTASLARTERAALLQRSQGFRKLRRAVMTSISARLDVDGLCRADVVMVENAWMYNNVSQQIGVAKTVFAPPGVDAHFYTPAPRYAEDAYALWVGRLNEPRKNIGLLLEAYARLLRVSPQTPDLVVCGRGEWTPAYASQATALGVTEHVRVYCNSSAEQLRELYRGAALFVLSSDEEGLGMVLLEAMASGLPVVSTDCGGPATAIVPGETGLLTPVGDAPALAGAMQALWEQPALRRQMGQAGRQRVVERFAIESAGAIYLQKYEELLAAGRHG